jgi:hypothetical protein
METLWRRPALYPVADVHRARGNYDHEAQMLRHAYALANTH